jgi:hypothetical protein
MFSARTIENRDAFFSAALPAFNKYTLADPFPEYESAATASFPHVTSEQMSGISGHHLLLL